MAQETFASTQFFSELDAAGESLVRERIATNRYGPNSDKLRLAQEWLRRKDQERSDSRQAVIEASNAEQIRIARSAKNAAWIAAIAAIAAAIAAALSIYFSFAR